MAARLLDPNADFAWLAEIEKDLALVMEPRSKFDRVVLSQHLMQASLTLMVEAKQSWRGTSVEVRPLLSYLTQGAIE
jgi:hypothetical protein